MLPTLALRVLGVGDPPPIPKVPAFPSLSGALPSLEEESAADRVEFVRVRRGKIWLERQDQEGVRVVAERLVLWSAQASQSTQGPLVRAY